MDKQTIIDYLRSQDVPEHLEPYHLAAADLIDELWLPLVEFGRADIALDSGDDFDLIDRHVETYDAVKRIARKAADAAGGSDG